MSDGSHDTPFERETPAVPKQDAPPFHYVVRDAGYGHPVGARIEAADTIEALGLATAAWAVRVPVTPPGNEGDV